MSNIFKILKINFINDLGLYKFKKYSIIKKILLVIFILYVLASLSMSVGVYTALIMDSLKKFNMTTYIIPMIYLLIFFMTFMITIYNSKATLFESKDNDILLSMPISKKAILISRVSKLVIINILISLFILIPSLVVYISRVDVNTSFYIFNIITVLFISIIPTTLAALFGYIIAYFTSKSNFKNIAEILLSLLFIFGIYYTMYNGQKLLTYFIHDKEEVLRIIKYLFYPVYLVTEIFIKESIKSLLLLVLINTVFISIFIYIMSIRYTSIISKLGENKTRSNFKMKSLKEEKPVKALLKKEIKRFFSSPIYVLNTSFGVILMFGLSIITMFYDKTKILGALEITGANISSFQLLLALVLMVTFMSNTTSVSISLEGKTFWIIKSLPIDIKKIFNTKILLNLLIIIPLSLISITIFRFTLGITNIEMLILFFFTILFSITTAFLGLLVNLRFPKMDAQNDTVVVKQSLSVMITLLIPLFINMLLIGLYSSYMNVIKLNTLLIIITIIFTIIIFIERLLLNKYGERLFKNIN